MKKSIFLSLILIVSLTTCRKGEEDPFLSFRSRTQRLEGVWNVKLSNGYIDLFEDGVKNRWFQSLHDPELINGYRFSIATYGTGYYDKYEDVYCNIGFGKDGETTFSLISPEMTYESGGTWRWENDRGKKKEYIYITDLNIFYNELIKDVCDKYSVFCLKENLAEHEDLKYMQIKKLTDKEIILFAKSQKEVAPEKGYDKVNIHFTITLTKD